MEQIKKKLTAQEILEKEFKKRTKGYDADEVDEFLDAVIYTIEQFEEEIQGLKSRNVQDEKQGLPSGKNVSASGRRQAEKLLEEAESRAQQILKETNENARLIVESAEIRLRDIRRETKKSEKQIREYRERLDGFMNEQKKLMEEKLGPFDNAADEQKQAVGRKEPEEQLRRFRSPLTREE